MASEAFWLLARLAVVAMNVGSICTAPQDNMEPDWRVGLLSGFAGSLAFSMWFTFARRRAGIDVTDPYAIGKPFFPIGRYPLRSWLLAAVSMILSGVAGLTAHLVGYGVATALPGMALALGLPLLATVIAWSKIVAGPAASA